MGWRFSPLPSAATAQQRGESDERAGFASRSLSAEAGGRAGPREDTAAGRLGVLHSEDDGQAQVRGGQGQGGMPAVLTLECAK